MIADQSCGNLLFQFVNDSIYRNMISRFIVSLEFTQKSLIDICCNSISLAAVIVIFETSIGLRRKT